MTATLQAPSGYVLGDGTTPREKAAGRWRRWNWLLWTFLAMIGIVGLSAAISVPPDVSDMSIYSDTDFGASATGNVLKKQGVDITQVSQLSTAAARLRPGDTLVIARYGFLTDDQVESIQSWDGPIVWIDPDASVLYEIDTRLRPGTSAGDAPRAVDCDLPQAIRANRVVTNQFGRDIDYFGNAARVTVCFRGGSGFVGAYVHLTRGSQGPVHLIADSSIVANGGLAEAGNAALTFNVIGATDRVVWYVSSFDSTLLETDNGGSDEYITTVTPSWLTPAIFMGAVILGVAVLWRGRRMGKLVTEPLPVVVRASEATRGRARLYRQRRSYGHAAAALRAGAISRMARRLGLSRTANHAAVIDSVASATGRPAIEVEELLYGLPPSDNASLMDTVARLDRLEREVHDS